MINFLQKNGNFNMQKLVSVISICTYLFIYAIAFNAFQFEGWFPGEWYDYRDAYFDIIAIFGTGFIATLFGYLMLNSYNRIKGNVLIILSGILQVILMNGAYSKAKSLNKGASIWRDGGLAWRCDFIMIMLVVVSIVAIVQILAAVFNLGLLFRSKEYINEGVEVNYDIKFYFHGVVLFTFISSAIVCYVFFLPILDAFDMIPRFLMGFGVPACILLLTVVNDWIEQKKYIHAIGAYLLYAYLVYGAVYRSVPAVNYEIYSSKETHIFFEHILEWINVAVAAVAVIKLIMMAMRNKKDISN